jgi:hypothetical protein
MILIGMTLFRKEVRGCLGAAIHRGSCVINETYPIFKLNCQSNHEVSRLSTDGCHIGDGHTTRHEFDGF